MSYYRVCPRCGSHLDPGEVCADCQVKENTPAGAANTDEGKVEQSLSDAVSASNNTKETEDLQA